MDAITDRAKKIDINTLRLQSNTWKLRAGRLNQRWTPDPGQGEEQRHSRRLPIQSDMPLHLLHMRMMIHLAVHLPHALFPPAAPRSKYQSKPDRLGRRGEAFIRSRCIYRRGIPSVAAGPFKAKAAVAKSHLGASDPAEREQKGATSIEDIAIGVCKERLYDSSPATTTRFDISSRRQDQIIEQR